MIIEDKLEEILDSSKYLLSDIKPSLWAEQNRVMTSDVTPWPGPFSFKMTPYMREVVDCLSPSHPARIVAVMKGAQIGFSTGVIENGIGWIISQNPGNILFMSGHELLAEESMNKKIDQMIDSCGLRSLIRPSILRKKNQRTGDTSKAKEFPGGSLTAGSASNHLLLRQRSIQYGFIDDFDSVEKQSKKSGNTRSMIQGRFAAYYDKMKLYYISTPELKASSNIEPVFLLGDQRRYHVPCPCCGELIPLYWEIEIDGTEGREKGGITWKTDESGRLIDGTVGYVCQKCSGFFDDSLKYEMNLAGEWIPGAEPSQIGYYSYHISSLYAPPGTYDWEYYVREWLEACPTNGKKSEQKYQAFINLNLGLTYEPSGEAPEASILQKNIRGYEVGVLPESLSVSDGNGKIVLLTCACDLNGTEQDARLDYEIVAWSESGVSYSVKHGSIGTFVPRETTKKVKEDRERWTYFHYKDKSVWPELKKIISEVYKTDTAFPLPNDIRNVGRPMRIALVGVDTGHYTQFAYEFIDNNHKRVIGIKGDKESKYRKFDMDSPSFKPSKERGDLYLLDVNFLKDGLAEAMKLTWDRGNEKQPFGFMNFPTPSQGLYLYQNYFEHFQSEHKVSETKDGEVIGFRWVKVNSNAQNHMWDVKIYNCALRDIIVDQTLKEFGIKKGTWQDFVKKIIPK